MRYQTYSQVTTGHPLRTLEHLLRHYPAMGCLQELMTARLTEHEAYLDDKETTIAILNSQNAVAYYEIRGLLQNFTLPEPNSQTLLINSLDDRYYTNFNI